MAKAEANRKELEQLAAEAENRLKFEVERARGNSNKTICSLAR